MRHSRPLAATDSPQSLRVRFQPRLKRLRSVLGVAGGIALSTTVTWAALELRLNLAAAGFLQLLIVLAVALEAGFWQATVVSVLANICLNFFFIPPLLTLTIADPQNWVALGVFEISALVVSRLSTKAKGQADEATRRQKELEQVYEVSRQLLLFGREASPALQILSLIQGVFRIEAGVLFDASQRDAELLGMDAAILESEARDAYMRDQDVESGDAHTWVRVLRFGVRPIGALALRGAPLTAATANALASLSAIALERAHSSKRESDAEAEKQSEQLRTTVLDALAHEYKTPLTVIRTAASGILGIGGLSAPQAELISLIDSETSRLAELTTRLLQMSRLDRADVRLRPQRVEVGELVLGLLSSTNNLVSGHAVRLEGAESGACIHADRELVHLALVQFLDNAAKYSDPASVITVAIKPLPGVVHISVHNRGSPIPAQDRERIFQRFYRSAGSQHKAAGTGVGLSISKKVAEAHLGRVWVTSKDGDGNTFFIELPRSKME